MSLAPSPQVAACLEVLYTATIAARMLGWKGQPAGLDAADCEQLAMLMNAVHNLPHHLLEWERCDESQLRETLGIFDKRFGYDLLGTYDRIVAKHTNTQSASQ
ncbi:MAG TPA: hypothetical protein VMJ10_33250 [Kofleriaceae bacterium]|nr:hypothetical protein [Kofleriaceae bacterium]